MGNMLHLLLKDIRSSRKMTTRQFADAVGLTNSYISQIERNCNARGKEIRLPVDTLKQICDGVGYSLSKLLEEAGYIEKSVAQTVTNSVLSEIIEIYNILPPSHQASLLHKARMEKADADAGDALNNNLDSKRSL